MKPYILLTCSTDYADEFDCCSISLMPTETWRKNVEKVREHESELEYREFDFGTNQYLVFLDLSSWASDFKEAEVSEEEALHLSKVVFGEDSLPEDFYHFGTVPDGWLFPADDV